WLEQTAHNRSVTGSSPVWSIAKKGTKRAKVVILCQIMLFFINFISII
ncbi:hypothetical protein HMPREF2097_00981, partial [Enterococcus faecalis 918]